MKLSDKLFVLFLNAAWMFFIYYLLRVNIELYNIWIPLIIPIVLSILCIIIWFKLRDEATQHNKIRN